MPYGVCSFKLWFCPCRFRDKIDVQQEAIALIACLATDVELVLHQSAIEGIHGTILNAMNSFPDQISLCEISLEALGECFCLSVQPYVSVLSIATYKHDSSLGRTAVFEIILKLFDAKDQYL